MKKLFALALAGLMLLSLAACTPTGPVQKTSSTMATTTKVNPEGVFYFQFNNQDLVPGTVFDGGWLPVPSSRYETGEQINGAAAIMYVYEYLFITTYPSGENEIIASIELNPDRAMTVATPEGLVLGASTATVVDIYGEDCTKTDFAWTYRKGDTLLVLEISEEAVTGIKLCIA